MKLTHNEQAMLDGKEGLAVQKAMELLIQYGEALDAEKLVDTNNVCGNMAAARYSQEFINKMGGDQAFFSEFHLNTPEITEMPKAKAFSCQNQTFLDPLSWQIQGVSQEHYDTHMKREALEARMGVQLLCTCTPYLVGNAPILGEHCAWMESSAVVYINSVLGARTNVEGRESSCAAMLTGKIPYWGYHIPENRLGTHLVEVEWDVDNTMDWGLLGYYTGHIVRDRIPVVNGIKKVPELEMLKHFGAAAASSGGVEMFHIPRITPEAASLETAFGHKRPVAAFKFGHRERQAAYEELNSTAEDSQVDFVMLGCPHASIKEIWQICGLLENKRLHGNTSLWIFTPRATKALADRNGYTKIISDAGGVLMSDTCCAMGGILPNGTRVAATKSAKQAHYLPAMLGVQCWFGSTEDCIKSAITGQWEGELG